MTVREPSLTIYTPLSAATSMKSDPAFEKMVMPSWRVTDTFMSEAPVMMIWPARALTFAPLSYRPLTALVVTLIRFDGDDSPRSYIAVTL